MQTIVTALRGLFDVVRMIDRSDPDVGVDVSLHRDNRARIRGHADAVIVFKIIGDALFRSVGIRHVPDLRGVASLLLRGYEQTSSILRPKQVANCSPTGRQILRLFRRKIKGLKMGAQTLWVFVNQRLKSD